MGCIERRQVRHTGKREILTSGALQRRQSEGKRAAKSPRKIVPVAERVRSSRRRTSNRPERPTLTPGDVPAAARIMSPVLLKTCLPRPTPAWAPAGRIVFSITGSWSASNCSGCRSRCYCGSLFPFANRRKRRGTASSEAIAAANRPKKQHRPNILFKEGPGP